ncbi:phage capsid and scaffold [Yersinia phage phiR1-RT]|uniref:Capsid and scaffold protein n=2 Tax=Tegunavirus TaxID=1921704 RepID=A0A0B4ZXF3_9CAUD|nr:head scaffolding protein [Yersinia phage phiR1-RT]YP_009200433.1 head scaffolding protein [Yersinia phage vB_YenM_TG1]AJD81982.1 capsid and scaffold protein [Yersinia phage vB_YenM_TG1]CCI88747.1 phage capsid and scaffold [Yersinia phage phiR1-RT]
MLIISDDHELVYENVQALIPEAQNRINFLATFSKDEITAITENMVDTTPDLAIAIASLNEEMELNEFIVKHVSSRGEVTKTHDRKTRSRRAFQTTGLSKAKRRAIARKVVRSKKSNPSATVRGSRKRKRAMKRRKIMGLS